MSTLSARKLVPILAVLIASTAVVAAQSGRRGGVKSSAPTPPVPSPTETQSKPQTSSSSRLEVLVAIDNPTGFDQVPYHIPNIVLETCVRRLAEAREVKPTGAPRRMTRGEAVKAAKAETSRYVVWLQVRNEQAESGADISTHSDQLYVTFVIYEPTTAKIKGSGRAQHGTARVGNVGVSGPAARRGVFSDYAIKETAKQAADKILNALQIKTDGWPR